MYRYNKLLGHGNAFDAHNLASSGLINSSRACRLIGAFFSAAEALSCGTPTLWNARLSLGRGQRWDRLWARGTPTMVVRYGLQAKLKMVSSVHNSISRTCVLRSGAQNRQQCIACIVVSQSRPSLFSPGTAPVLKSAMLLDPRFQPCLRAVRTGARRVMLSSYVLHV